MKKSIVFLAFLAAIFVAVVNGQLFGNNANNKNRATAFFKTRPIIKPVVYSPVTLNNAGGRYNNNNDGRYVPDNSGRYDNNDGRYVPDNSGQYVHQDPGYKHILGPDGGSGGAGPGPEKYRGGGYYDASGKYIHQDNPYKHAEGPNGPGGPGAEKYRHQSDAGKYIHKDDPYKHINGPNGPNGPGAEKYKPYVATIDGQNARGKAILHKCKEVDPEGYSYNYDTQHFTANGAEDGALQHRGTDKEAMCAIGYYNYIGTDNKEVTTYYIADEYGYRPVGDHIHPSIAKMLKYLEEHVE